MPRSILTDTLWESLQQTMKKHGCHRWKNDRNIIEAILWKLRTGSPWRDIPPEFCRWKTAYNRFNRWASKGLWQNFFLAYEAKLIRSGYSQMEAMLGLISMQVELGVEKKERLENLVGAEQLNFILPPIRMETRSILKSLGVKSTTARLRLYSSKE